MIKLTNPPKRRRFVDDVKKEKELLAWCEIPEEFMPKPKRNYFGSEDDAFSTTSSQIEKEKQRALKERLDRLEAKLSRSRCGRKNAKTKFFNSTRGGGEGEDDVECVAHEHDAINMDTSSIEGYPRVIHECPASYYEDRNYKNKKSVGGGVRPMRDTIRTEVLFGDLML